MSDFPPSGFEMTIGELVCHAAAKYGEKSAVLSNVESRVLTFDEIGKAVASTSGWLMAKGVKRGDRLCFFSSADPAAMILFWSAACVGAISVPVDPLLGTSSVDYILRHADPKYIFCDSSMVDKCLTATQSGERIIPISSCFSSAAEIPRNEYLYDTFSGECMTTPGDPAVILYTSGSMGHPKGVLLSHGALCRSGALMGDFYQWDSGDVFLNLAELHTMSGLRNSCITPLFAGCAVWKPPGESTRPVFSVVEEIRGGGCTLLGCGPMFIKQLRMFEDRIDSSALRSLRAFLCTGSALDPGLARWAYDHYGIPVLNYYGLTETTGFCAGHSFESFLENTGGIGLPVGASIDIVDENQGLVPGGQAGEIRISGPNLMLGYYREPELTAEVLCERGFLTGDTGFLAADGSIFLAGRKRNFIKTAGTELVHFEEVEMELEQHPMVKEAGVCSFVSGLGEERLAAFVVPTAYISSSMSFFNTLREFTGHRLGHHKVPSLFHIVSELPRNSSGKLRRTELKGVLTGVRLS